MLITNCQIIFKDKIEKGAVRIEDGKITAINPEIQKDEEVVDAKGMYLSPGFIDIHIHGAAGYDTMDGTNEAINSIAKAIAKHGTTSFLPTTMTMSVAEINQTLKVIAQLMKEGAKGVNVLGAHLEGPFISPKAIGAQNPKHLISPSIEAYDEMVKGCEEAVISMTLAPEVEGAEALIRYLRDKGVMCSAGHTKATYEEMMAAISWGVTHGTHLYNGMSAFTHREPGVVGAIFDSEITTETISDGIHSDYAALRIAYKQKGTDKVMLISDAMMACCMPDGKYALGGQDVFVTNNAARLENGALAGSVLTLDKAIHNVHTNCKLPLYEVVKMATYNPAKFCSVEDHKGLIAEGYDADLVLFDENIKVSKVWIKGKQLN
ncbi:N-acetylglucosamine-6-phosphate deacetylase [Cellulosilyticum ruminicola]|uniref:N-acetylglucosamine-6-phosphate deacetylase n=1 Tax=Cellulosilyticum ruminicola TaxID=425254 RepID=UPI0006D178A8|nr:N-acetylglucosamine-6-phosphate deacetylase [Cellulosilyticum ruminicola]